MDLTKEQHQILCKSCKNVTKTMAMIGQVFGEESTSSTRASEWHAQFRADQVRRDRFKSMPIIFFDIKGIVNKEFVLEGHKVNSAYYCDVLQRLCENVR
jgi:hypothetical protein